MLVKLKAKKTKFYFLALLILNNCATSSLNTSDPFVLRQMITVNEASIIDQEDFSDAMTFCSFEAAYMDVSKDGQILLGSAVGGAAAVAAAPAYFYAAPMFLLGGAVAYFFGKGTEKANEDNVRLGVMVACVQGRGYEVLVDGAFTSNSNLTKDTKETKEEPDKEVDQEDPINEVFNPIEINEEVISNYDVTYKDPSLDKENNSKSPIYPKDSLSKGHEGTVKLIFRVSEEGKPVNIMVHQSSGYSMLDKAAVITLLDTNFNPAIQNDKKILSKKVIRTYMFKADTSLSTRTNKPRTLSTN